MRLGPTRPLAESLEVVPTRQPQPITGKRLRRIILDQSRRAGVGHIGSALSIADMMAVLFSDVLRVNSTDDPDRDRFVLSKGHAALCLYAALYLAGRIPREALDKFCGDDTRLGVHPEFQLNGVDFSTGSLGMGMTFAVGAALAARLQSSRRKTYVLLSDAECNEGSVWEAVMFAAHHKLANLTVLVDLNGQQALGYTKDVLSLPRMVERWDTFGWQAIEVDGHDTQALRDALVADREGRPRVLLCKTVFGKGVSFMERQIPWHYLPVSDAEYARAVQEIESDPCE